MDPRTYRTEINTVDFVKKCKLNSAMRYSFNRCLPPPTLQNITSNYALCCENSVNVPLHRRKATITPASNVYVVIYIHSCWHQFSAIRYVKVRITYPPYKNIRVSTFLMLKLLPLTQLRRAIN